MSFADVISYISPALSILTTVGGLVVISRNILKDGQANREAQALQHQANLHRLDGLAERVKAVEEISRQQTAILINNGRIEERLNGHAERLEGHDQRIGQLENREAGRRIAAKGT